MTCKLNRNCDIFVGRLLIVFVEGNDPMWKGFLFAAVMFIATMTQTLLQSQYFYRMNLIGMRIKTALIAAIYCKVWSVIDHFVVQSTGWHYILVYLNGRFLLIGSSNVQQRPERFYTGRNCKPHVRGCATIYTYDGSREYYVVFSSSDCSGNVLSL